MDDQIKTSNLITLFVVAHLAALAMAWVAYAFVVKTYPEQMLGSGEYMQLVPVDDAMLIRLQSERTKKENSR
ncbi:MAG: hypothetical protein ABL923_08830 [Burkholderiaceae bacterium]